MKQSRIGISVNRKKDGDLQVTRNVVDCILKYGMKPLLLKAVANEIGFEDGYEAEQIYSESDFIVSLGGDGTLLNTARSVFGHQVPVFGINLGTVGFLAEVEVSDIECAIKNLFSGDFTLKNRMVLRASVIRSNHPVFESFAINDVVVSRGGLSRIIRLMVFVDDQFIDSFPGDGLIVSTPTGSTAYTLSAGGPIVQPDMHMMITTPICPHILYSRSFITGPDRELSIRINEDYPDSAIITMDGQEGFSIMAGDRIVIRKAEKGIDFVSFGNINFYDVLRAKIHVHGAT